MEDKKPEIEIVEIGSDIDIEARIREMTDQPIKVSEDRLDGLKPQKSKAERDQDRWETKMNNLRAIFEERLKTDNIYVSKNEIMESVGINDGQFSGFITRFRNYLRRDDTWTIDKKRIKKVLHYYFIRFGGDG